MEDEEGKEFRYRLPESEHPDDEEKERLKKSIDNLEKKLHQMALNIALNSSLSTELSWRIIPLINKPDRRIGPIFTEINAPLKFILPGSVKPRQVNRERE